MSAHEDALDRAVIGLFRKKNSVFLSTIYCGLQKVWTEEDNPTAYTNGKILAINPDWFLSLTERSRISLIAHEIWHVALQHMYRMNGSRDQGTWNEACDHAINLMLLEHGYHFDMSGCYDPRFSGMAAEQIYDVLHKEKQAGNSGYHPDAFGQCCRKPEGKQPEEEEADILEITALVVRATVAQEMSDEAGSYPGGFEEMMKQLKEPKISWDRQLAKWLTHRSETSASWRRPNRRYEDVYLPGRGGEEGLEHLVWAFDCSGSMTPEMVCTINSEISGAKEQFNPERMTVISFDTKIQTIWEYSQDEEIPPLNVVGWGGTNMDELFQWATSKKPTAMVVFSDMECHIPHQVPGLNILWVCFNDPTWVPPYGDVIHVDCQS